MKTQNERNNLPIYPISSAAKLLNISVHTLRMYEQEGLIIPYKKDSGHRLYSDDDIERLKCIRYAINDLKISINGIKTIYSLIPCWKIKKCSQEDQRKCKAYNSHLRPCWSYKHKKNICSRLKCYDCEVYTEFADCEKVKDALKNFILSD